MVFSFEITTLASISSKTPDITRLPISKGIIRHWHILFPEGNWCEAPLRLMKGGSPILPMNPETGMKGNGVPFVSEEFLFIKEPPWEIQAYTWNEDTQNSHTIYINITVMPLWTLLPYSNQLMELLEKEEVRLVL